MLCLLVASLLNASAADQPVQIGDVLCHPRRLLAKFASLHQAETTLPKRSKLLRWIPELNIAVIETPRGALQQTRNAMLSRSGAEWVDFDHASRPAYEPNDPLWPDMWHMTAIKANLAWDHSFGGPSAIVAVIDTGVDVEHEDLSPNVWVNTGEIPGNSLDDDGNGYVDDVHGYDFAYNDPDPDDQFGHGTACAGLVAAVQDNGLGVTGVAPRARIMAIKAALDDGFFYDSATIPAYMYAVDNGAKVLSMSYFTDRVVPAEGDAIRFCASHGVLPVAAAGNASTTYPYYPAAYDATLSVAALGTSLKKAGFSNWGTWVDVAAPGTNLRTTTAGGGYTAGFGGTSGATPHVAGLAALLFGARPSATVEEVRAAIEDTAVPVNQPPYGEFCNYGIIDCEAAMNAILGTPAPPRAPAVRALSACGAQLVHSVSGGANHLPVRVIGRGFATASSATVKMGSVSLIVLDRQRDWITGVYKTAGGNPFELWLDGSLVTSFPMPDTVGLVHPLIDASTPEGGATCTGGFFESLREDGLFVKATRRNDDSILLHGTFKNVARNAALDLVVRRQFTGGAVGTETIQVYDWSSASYPYGSFVTLSSGPVPSDMTTSTFVLSDPGRFIDPEGTVYLRILTTDGQPSTAELHLDMAHLAVH